jgi:hypothetical protein
MEKFKVTWLPIIVQSLQSTQKHVPTSKFDCEIGNARKKIKELSACLYDKLNTETPIWDGDYNTLFPASP